jgi:NAD(P)H-hydrate epimerase
MTFLTRASARAVDEIAIRDYHLPGLVLMENAGRGAAEWLRELGPASPVCICCGNGNNGGDGFVIARHLELFGIAVEVLVCCDPAELTGDARVNYDVVTAAGLPRWHLGRDGSLADLATRLTQAGWIVDALLGTGARGAPRDPLAGVIRAINAAARPVLAVDLPSGLDADMGEMPGECVRAQFTATFVAPKRGFAAPGARDVTGEVRVIEIGIPRRLRDQVLAKADGG